MNSILKAQQLWQPTASKLITLWWFFPFSASTKNRIDGRTCTSTLSSVLAFTFPHFLPLESWGSYLCHFCEELKSWRTCFNFAQSNPIRCRCWVSCWEGFSCILCATSCTPKRINHDQTNRIQQKTGRTSDMLCKIQMQILSSAVVELQQNLASAVSIKWCGLSSCFTSLR